MSELIDLNMGDETKLHSKDQENVEVETVKAEFKKYPVEEILKAAEEIDTDTVAEEVITWLNYNLENYIDNSAKMFKIPIDDLDVQARENHEVPKALPELYPHECLMTETKKLQSLYRAIPDDEEGADVDKCHSCRMKLHEITEEAWKAIPSKTDLLDMLYRRMVYYYEFRGFDKKGNEIVEQFNGLVSVLKFEYESFSVGVTLREGSQEGVPDSERKVLKEYVIPEGFVVWVELALKSGGRPTVMF